MSFNKHFSLRRTVFSKSMRCVLVALGGSKHDTRKTITLRGPDGRPAPTARLVKLCCDSVDKRDDDLNYQGCLTKAIVKQWEADPVLSPGLDAALLDCTCQVCRLFGTPWLAGRVHLADLTAIGWQGQYESRGGLSISRETDTAIDGSAYQRQALPAGLRFTFRLTVENATLIEQAMVLMGLQAFETGIIALGSDRTRGMGRGHLAIDWWNCRYVDDSQLLSGLLVGTDPQVFSEADAEARIGALATFLRSP